MVEAEEPERCSAQPETLPDRHEEVKKAAQLERMADMNSLERRRLTRSSGETCKRGLAPGLAGLESIGPIHEVFRGVLPMHVLFVHQNLPAQFGNVSAHLVRTRGWRCTFVSQTPEGDVNEVRKIQYRTAGGARESTHYCSRTFENAVWHAHAVYEACKAHPEIRPDLIVGHSGFGSTLLSGGGGSIRFHG